MSFSQMINILRQKHKEEILLINAGAFYIAIEEDAVLLNNKLKLKCSCFQKNTCKVGVPINSLNKYLEKIFICKGIIPNIIKRININPTLPTKSRDKAPDLKSCAFLDDST